MRVSVHLLAVQVLDGTRESTEQSIFGILTETGRNSLSLTFQLNGVHHQLLIDETLNEISLIRNRCPGRTILYRDGHSMETEYETPYGMLVLEFKTREVLISRTEHLLRLHLSYSICQSGDEISGQELEIEISPLAE